MVGRGGRSKACFICRQRRVKCDETRPKCRRCQTGGRECTGYPEGLNFINDSPLHRLREQAPSHNLAPTPRLDKVHESLNVLGDNVYFSFLLHQLRAESDFIHEGWPGFSALKMSDGLAQRCLRSFAMSLFGRANGLKDTQAGGMRLYSTSLKELNKCLEEPEKSAPSQTMLSIAILNACECFISTSPTGWIQHMLGLAAYFKLQGLATFQDPNALNVFETHRFSMIIAAVATRRPTYLALEEWKSEPWSMTGAHKSSRHYLIDHAAEIPNLYPDFISYLNTPSAQLKSSLRSKLEKDIQRIVENLHGWLAQWSREETEIKEVTLSPKEQAKYGFATKLNFGVQDQAFTYVMYNTILIILLELWKRFRIEQLLNSSSAPEEEKEEVGEEYPSSTVDGDDGNACSPNSASLASQTHIAAVDLCRTLVVFVSPSGELSHGLALLLSIRMALIVFRQEPGSVPGAWLEECISQISEGRRGWEVGRYAMQEFAYR